MYTPLIYPSPEKRDNLRLYLQQEIDNHNSERSAWVDTIKRYDRLYWAEPASSPSQGPIKFGATIIIPIVATAVEMYQAKQMQKLFGLEQFVALTFPDNYADIDRDVEKLVDHELLVTANIRKSVEDVALEFDKFGTGIFKNGYEYVTKKAVFYDEDGTEVTRDVVVNKGLFIDAVQNANFLMPFTANDVGSAPWCGEVHFSTPYEIGIMVRNGFFEDDIYDKLETYFTSIGDSIGSPSQPYRDQKESEEKRVPLWPKRIDWTEIFLAFDIDGDGEKEEIVVYYHRLSDIILGIRYNDRHDVSRPYFYKAFFPVEGRWPGIGLCKMGEQFQAEVTTQHRQRLDAGSLANLRMFKAKKGSGINADEPVYYGKIWMVDEMNDLDMFQIGEVYPSAYQNEQATMLQWQQRSGVHELSLGLPQVGTPGTAAAELARQQESNTRFDYTYNRLKSLVREVALDSMCVIGKYGVRHEVIYSTLRNGEKVRRFLSLSPELIKNEILVKFDLAGASQNKLIDRASWTQLSGILTQYFTNNLQLATQIGDQAIVQAIVKKSMTASTEVIKQILESFDVRNIERIILTPDDLNGPPSIENPELNSGIAGLIQNSGMGYVNPINTTVGG